MKESSSEVLARRTDPESYAGGGDTIGVATTRAHVGRVLSSEIRFLSRADSVQMVEGNIIVIAPGDDHDERGGVEDLGHAWKLQAREPGDPNGLLEEVASSGQRTPPEVMLT